VRDPLRTEAARAAEEAARECGVFVDEVEDNDTLRDVSALLESVWGRTAEGVPIASDVMRSFVHAGGCITTARDSHRTVVGATVLVPADDGGYSLIAATAPHQASRGLGRALKLRQRAWALDRGWRRIQWTFDPLVSRNARFNLSRLGALATAYEQDFYGHMADDINANDHSDRLVATWKLDTARAIAAADGRPTADLVTPDDATIISRGPDGQPLMVGDGRRRWCRVPDDIVTIRREQPELAQQWRMALRTGFREAFTEGLIAVGFSRDGWYALDQIKKDEQ
jgi:predicted GNAT superfamily acetyltransferase